MDYESLPAFSEVIMLDLIMNKIKKLDLFSDLFNFKTLIQFIKYCISGLAVAAIEYFVFFVLYKQIGFWHVTSNSLAMAIGFLISFLLNRYWSFKSKANIFRQIAAYGMAFAINLLISNVFMLIFSDNLGIAPPLSKLLVMMIIGIWNFIIFKKVIYCT
jgi:putative flippase GtrA